MKKIVQMLLIACMVVLSTQVAFANSDKETIQDGANLVTVKRLAVASPLYQQLDTNAPSKDLLTQIVYDREERSQLAIKQGRFTEEHFIKPHREALEQWATACPL